MGYTCSICTDYVDPTKTEEILKNVAKIITQALKNAPSGMAVPSGADQIIQVHNSTKVG